MQPKNVMLLGFINKAVEYLDDHIDDSNATIEELKKIDLISLKDELANNIGESLGTVQSTMETLLNAGGEAFDEFIEVHDDRVQDDSDEYEQIFRQSETLANEKAKLDKLLAFYNIDKENDLPPVEVEDPLISTIKENIDAGIKKDDVPELKKPSAELDNVLSEIVVNELKSDNNTISFVNAKTNKEKKAKFDKVVEKIHKAYTYLPKSFIASVYNMKDAFKEEYGSYENIIILHRVAFNDVEDLRQFAEICLNHGFTINVDEKKMIVDVFKQYENVEGRIVKSIFEIANQGYLLNGAYEGYRIITNDDK